MSDRKRINVSVDPETYEDLTEIKKSYGFANLCEVLVAFAHILVDRRRKNDKRRYDLPEDDGQYIDNMFDDLGHCQRTPDGTVPVGHNVRFDKYGDGGACATVVCVDDGSALDGGYPTKEGRTEKDQGGEAGQSEEEYESEMATAAEVP